MRKIWVRVLVSILIGGVVNEILILALSPYPNSEQGNFTLLLAIVSFILISLYYVFEKYKYYYFGSKEENEQSTSNTDILDDDFNEK